MDFCPFHNQSCEESKMITIIELKNGKIIQTKICEDCISKHMKEQSILSELPDDPKDILGVFMKVRRDKGELECPTCLTLNVEESKMSLEQRIKVLEGKMAAAVKVEDYETAAKVKKEIEQIKNSN